MNSFLRDFWQKKSCFLSIKTLEELLCFEKTISRLFFFNEVRYYLHAVRMYDRKPFFSKRKFIIYSFKHTFGCKDCIIYHFFERKVLMCKNIYYICKISQNLLMLLTLYAVP